VASILLYGLPLAERLNAPSRKTPPLPSELIGWRLKALRATRRSLLGTFSISLAAFLGTSLLGVAYFEVLPLWGVLLNMIALPLASLAVVAGFVSLLLSLLHLPWLPELFNHAAALILAVIQAGLETVAASPRATLAFEAPAVSFLLLAAAAFLPLLAAGRLLGWGRRGRLLWLPPAAIAAAHALHAAL